MFHIFLFSHFKIILLIPLRAVKKKDKQAPPKPERSGNDGGSPGGHRAIVEKMLKIQVSGNLAMPPIAIIIYNMGDVIRLSGVVDVLKD